MEEIIFRAKSLNTGEWVYGGYYNLPDCRKDELRHIIVYENNGHGLQTVHEPVDVTTLGQYTGENDVNGNEIYGGMQVHQVAVLIGSQDIDFVGEVKFNEGSWWIDSGEDAVYLFNEGCENTIVDNQ